MTSFHVIALFALGFIAPLYADDLSSCAGPLIQFIDDYVHDYMKDHTLPEANIAGRATFYNGKLTGTSKVNRLEPTNISAKGNNIYVESRFQIPLFRASYQCKYRILRESSCPNVNITTSNAVGMITLVIDQNLHSVKLEDMTLITAQNNIEISPIWLKPLVENMTDDRLKKRFGELYKTIINKSNVKVPQQIDSSCQAAAFSNELKPLPLAYKPLPKRRVF